MMASHLHGQREPVDHITSRVVSHAFRSICEEMGHTMIRTANSSLFVEGRDFSCAIVDPQAELIAAANFDPSHLSAMALTVEFAVTYFGPESIRKGDVYLVNDPYRGGGHLPDITLIRPVFHGERLIGFAVNRAHHIDIGGMAVAGFPGTAHSIYQEGLRIPPVRWFDAGRENRDIIELITLNMRFPRDQLGDFQAQLSSTWTAERRLLSLVEKYGADTIEACMEETKSHSEELMRAIIREIPDGSYTFTELIDDDGVSDQPYKIVVTVDIRDDDVTIDYTGTSPQAGGPINSSYGNTLSSTFNAMLQLLGPDVPFNAGCFRPVRVVAPRGCLLNPVPPAPCFGGVTEVSIRIIDAVLGAIAGAARNRVGAGSYGTCINFSGGGFDPERSQAFGFYFFVEGGWGACSWRDGWNTTPNPTSNFNDYPVEWIEATLPIRYLEARLNTDSGGQGRYRGGVGVVRTFEVLAEDVEINALGERFLIPPFGLEGGLPGGCNNVLVRTETQGPWRTIKKAFHTQSPSKFHGVKAGKGVVFSVISGGGGGFGRAHDRPPEEVLVDVRLGYVSREAAARDYGVRIAEAPDGTLWVDEPETTKLRTLMQGRRDPRLDSYRRLRKRALSRAASGETTAQAQAEINAVHELATRVRSRLASSKRQGQTHLDDPFSNVRAMEYWDSDSLRNWMHRRGISS
jgi:N-methylhydantoinase B/oxoprolinase/acetone carboxylase alpha subunit